MQITSLAIKGFRNLSPLNLNLENDPNVIVLAGKNGQGKTNILEAVYLCALSKSFRTQKNQELVQFDESYSTIKATAGENCFEVAIMADPPQKSLKINGLKRSALDFVGQLKAVFFSPDDLAFMAFAPRLRRRYLDVLLSQLNRDYLQALTRYEAARKQRNALLRRLKNGEGDLAEINFWDQLLAEYGLFVFKERKHLIYQLTPFLDKYYRAISQLDERLTVTYLSEGLDIESSEAYENHLKKSYEIDIATGKTSFGPQRDDLDFSLNDKNMKSFSSRGEWRSLVLALKFAEIELLKQKTQEDPILLLDDVFSELDEIRQKYLLEALGGIQTFITTTHAEFFDAISLPHKVYQVERGVITN